MNKIRKGRFVPLIIILILICVVPTIVLVVRQAIGRPQETAELNKDIEQQEEQISAATTTVNEGDTYTVPKTGTYKIELRGEDSYSLTDDSSGGDSFSLKASKISGYIRLNQGDVIEAVKQGSYYTMEGSVTTNDDPDFRVAGYGRIYEIKWKRGPVGLLEPQV